MTRSLFRYPGGKAKLMSSLARYMPACVDGFIDPFAGGWGAVLNVPVPVQTFIIGDANRAVTEALAFCLRAEGPVTEADFLAAVPAADWAMTSKASFVRVKREVSRGAHPLAAVYLSAANFNGLWRVNRSGVINSPYGESRPVDLAKAVEIAGEVRAALYGKSLVAVADWRSTLDVAVLRAGFPDPSKCLVFADPPYLGRFDAYTAAGFGLDEHVALAEHLALLAGHGFNVLSTNSMEAWGLYEQFPCFKVGSVAEMTLISATKGGRGEMATLLVTTPLVR